MRLQTPRVLSWLRERAAPRCKRDPINDVRVASPCTASWETMTGNDRVRFCHACHLNVYSLSAMGRVGALRLIASQEGRFCVRFFRRSDGTVLTADCLVGVAAMKRRAADLLVAVATGFVFIATGVYALVSDGGRAILRASSMPGARGLESSLRDGDDLVSRAWPLSAVLRWLDAARSCVTPADWNGHGGGNFLMGDISDPSVPSEASDAAATQAPPIDRILVTRPSKQG